MNATLRTPLYVRHQTAADLGNWSVARDIAWDLVPVIGADETTVPVHGLREACLIEAVQLVTLSRLASDVAADVDASIALAIISQESAKHFHAIRLYLDTSRARPRLTDAEIQVARTSALDFPAGLEPVEASVGLLKAVHMASHFYRTLATRARCSVLRDLLRLVAADKVRHGRMAGDVLEGWVASDRTLGPRVRNAASHLQAFDAEVDTDPASGWPAPDRAPLRTLITRLDRICGTAPHPIRSTISPGQPAFAAAG